MTIGVLALQGAFREHKQALTHVGATVREVRLPQDLEGLKGLIIPGGESTTMAKLTLSYGFDEALQDFYAQGGAIWGTCAGAIMVSKEIIGYPEQFRLGLIDISVDRNAYGRQVASFETDISLNDEPEPFHAIFIRAPRIKRVGEGVKVLASYAENAVMVSQDRVLASVFHPELSQDYRIHKYFIEKIVNTPT